MKKVIFLQNKGKSYGGVFQVNKLVGEELIKNGYDVTILSIRNNQGDFKIEHDDRLKIKTVNEEDLWGTYTGSEIVKEIKTFHILKPIKMFISRIKYDIGLKKDEKKLKKILLKENPNYIIVSHYQILDMIPKEYLGKTINIQHSSFKVAINHKATRRTMLKYKDKIQYVWLTKETMNLAKKYGFKNSKYIYNAVRFKSSKIANVIENKKLIAISRIDSDKNIGEMIDILEEVFEDKSLKNWKFEIYGSGDEEKKIKNKIKNKEQIKLMGVTKNPKDELLKASINLNTSKYEGFSLSILEANECGIPTIAYNFGESANEQIINGKTGIIANNRQEYVSNLKELMLSNNKLLGLSKECKEYSKKFQIENIVKDWIKLFDSIELKI